VVPESLRVAVRSEQTRVSRAFGSVSRDGSSREALESRNRPNARIFTIFEGTSEIQRMIIGRAVTGLDVR
jgi:alkylation response protein AidB-like acyl-CoA dehydrogenase